MGKWICGQKWANYNLEVNPLLDWNTYQFINVNRSELDITTQAYLYYRLTIILLPVRQLHASRQNRRNHPEYIQIYGLGSITWMICLGMGISNCSHALTLWKWVLHSRIKSVTPTNNWGSIGRNEPHSTMIQMQRVTVSYPKEIKWCFSEVVWFKHMCGLREVKKGGQSYKLCSFLSYHLFPTFMELWNVTTAISRGCAIVFLYASYTCMYMSVKRLSCI